MGTSCGNRFAGLATPDAPDVVTEELQVELDVEEVDRDAPKDEWGFPALAGSLSRCGGACAPHCDRSPQLETNGLVNQLLKVDLVEAYSPPRVTLEAKKFGLKQGEAFDLTNGWNFNIKLHQDAAWKYNEEKASSDNR